MSILFISDIHLQSDSPLLADRFRSFFAGLESHVTAVYILGDLFEMWIGDDAVDSFSQQIIDILHQASRRGIALYFQHGNRDFLISTVFATHSGCQLLPEEHVLQVNNQRVLLMHGDTLCEKDVGYQRARKWFHSPWIQRIFLSLPLTWRRSVARRLRQTSKEYTHQQRSDIMDVTQEAVDRVMRKHQADVLIHGHTHREGIHTFVLDGKAGRRIVLPAWHDHADAMVLTEDGSFSWQSIF